jgi:hypothetical protein
MAVQGRFRAWIGRYAVRRAYSKTCAVPRTRI